MRRAVEMSYCGVCRPLIPDFFEGADGGLTHSRANVDPCGRVSIEVWRGLRLLASTEGVGSDAMRALESLAYRLGEDAGPLLRALRLTLLKFPPRERRCLAGEQRLLGYVEELLRAGADPREAAESLLGARKLVVVRPNGRLYVGRPLLRAWGVEGEYVKVRVQGRTAITRVGGKGVVLHSLVPGLTRLEIEGLDRRALLAEICGPHRWAYVEGDTLVVRAGRAEWRIPVNEVSVGTSSRTAGSGVMRADVILRDVTIRLLSNGRAYVWPRYSTNLEVLVDFRELGGGLIEVLTRRYPIRGRVVKEGILLSGLGFYYFVGPDRGIYLSQEILVRLSERKKRSFTSRLGRAGELIVHDLGPDPSFPIFSGLRSEVEGWIDPNVWHRLYSGHSRPDLFARFQGGECGPVDVKSTVSGTRWSKRSDLHDYVAQVRRYARRAGARRGLIVALKFDGVSGRLEEVKLHGVTCDL